MDLHGHKLTHMEINMNLVQRMYANYTHIPRVWRAWDVTELLSETINSCSGDFCAAQSCWGLCAVATKFALSVG